jgi:hypothetical protein
MESPNPEVTVTVAEDLALVARASTAHGMALVMVSMPQPTSSSAAHASTSQCLEDDVVLQFDATHRLSELTVTWQKLSAGVASFGEQLRVSVFSSCFLFSGRPTSFSSLSYFFLFFVIEVLLSGSL